MSYVGQFGLARCLQNIVDYRRNVVISYLVPAKESQRDTIIRPIKGNINYLNFQYSSEFGLRVACFLEYLLPRKLPSHTSYDCSASSIARDTKQIVNSCHSEHRYWEVVTKEVKKIEVKLIRSTCFRIDA